MNRTATAFFVFDRRTGEIIRSGTCAHDDLPAQASSGDHEVRAGKADDGAQYVDLATGEIAERPALPPFGPVFAGPVAVEIATGFPPRTIVRVTGIVGAFARINEDGALLMTSPQAGTLDVELLPPFPRRPERRRLIVSPATAPIIT